MVRAVLPLTLIFCLVGTAAAQAVAEEILPAGTLLQCTLDEPNFSSHTAQIGDPVLCHVGALADRAAEARLWDDQLLRRGLE